MLTRKILFNYYNAIFRMYGNLGCECLKKARENPDEAETWMERAQWCINKRSDILQQLEKLVGLE